MRALAWTHPKLMFIVPFALSDEVAYNKGGKLDYGWDNLPFVKEYQAKHKGKMPSIVCDIFFFVPGSASGLFMNNMKSMLYDGYKAPGTPMTQMCPKDDCPGGCQLCALKVAATTTTPTHHQDPPRIRPLTTHSPRTHHPLCGGCRLCAMKVSFEDNWVVEVCTSGTYDANAGYEWNPIYALVGRQKESRVIVPRAISLARPADSRLAPR